MKGIMNTLFGKKNRSRTISFSLVILVYIVIEILKILPEKTVIHRFTGDGAKKDLILKSQQGRLRHLIITAPHPSPLSAYRGFFGGS